MSSTSPKRRKLVSQRELARRLEVSVRTIQNDVDRGMPREKKSGRWVYDVSACRKWRRARERARKAERKKGSPPKSDLDRARLKKAQALARRSETKLAKLQRTTLPAGVADELLAESIADLQAVAEPFPAQWAKRLASIEDVAEASEGLRDFTDALFAALADAPDPEERAPEAPWEAPTTLNEARARRWTADAEVIEMGAAVESGVRVTLDSLEDRLRAVCMGVRSTLLALPGRRAHEIVGLTTAAARKVLARALAEAFEDIER